VNGRLVHDYPLRVEQAYCSTPEECRRVDVPVVGSAVRLGSVPHLLERARAMGIAPTMAVADAEPRGAQALPGTFRKRSGTSGAAGASSGWRQ
jgi:hypothetical protein